MSVQTKINIGVIGATGYTGLDLIFLLSKHPKINIKYLCATKNIGKNINFFDKRIKKKLPKITQVSKIIWNNLDSNSYSKNSDSNFLFKTNVLISFLANKSTTQNPTLCLVGKYFCSGLPRPTISCNDI